LAVLIRRELLKSGPLIPLDLLRRRGFRISVIASICCFAGQMAALVALPFHLHRLGLSPLETGLYLTIWPASVAATALTLGRRADSLPTARLCAVGGLLLALGLAGAALLSSRSEA